MFVFTNRALVKQPFLVHILFDVFILQNVYPVFVPSEGPQRPLHKLKHTRSHFKAVKKQPNKTIAKQLKSELVKGMLLMNIECVHLFYLLRPFLWRFHFHCHTGLLLIGQQVNVFYKQ